MAVRPIRLLFRHRSPRCVYEAGLRGERGGILRRPSQARLIGASLVERKIPINLVRKPRHVSVQEPKLRAALVQVGMDVVLLGDGGKLAIVEQPDYLRDRANG